MFFCIDLVEVQLTIKTNPIGRKIDFEVRIIELAFVQVL